MNYTQLLALEFVDFDIKIGTYLKALSAFDNNIPFYVAAPTSTIDFGMISGKEIPIEQRSESEVTEIRGHRIAPAGVDVYAPAFDVTPAALITAIVTEQGVLRGPFRQAIEGLKRHSQRTQR